jgi:hypothetical protein
MTHLTSQNIEGKRIKMILMEDIEPIEPGAMGTVIKMNNYQIIVKWDSGRSLSVIPGEDQFEIED